MKRTNAELMALLLPNMSEKIIQNYINTEVKAMGYDDENSIAKYLVPGNEFYDECSSISLWIGNVWKESNIIQTNILKGTISIPTEDELIAMLPILGGEKL